MRPCQRPSPLVPRQLSLLATTTRPQLNPDERREVIALLAVLLIKASGARRCRRRPMTGVELLPPEVLRRKAVVYIRQSTQAQMQAHTESTRRQHELFDLIRRRGFHQAEVIDDGLGRSASGTMARPLALTYRNGIHPIRIKRNMIPDCLHRIIRRFIIQTAFVARSPPEGML